VTIDDTTHLASLGWDAGWAAAFHASRELPDNRSEHTVVPGRVVAEHRERYTVSAPDGEVSAVLAGRVRHILGARVELPAGGDWVGIARGPDAGTALIRFVVPRRSAFLRKSAGSVTEAQVVAVNVDVALIVTALPGDLNARRLERYMTLAWESGATPLIVLTKSDLSDDVRGALSHAGLAAPGVEAIAVSAMNGDGMDLLAAWLVPGRTAVLLGSSGVGKSTLVNRLLGAAQQRTADLASTGRGRHTTTHRELVRLANGALLIDTPGMRELQLWNADDGLGPPFSDVEAYAETCRFRDCVHDQEPGCAVREAVASGKLAGERLEYWHRLRRELGFLARKQDQRADAEQRHRIRGLMRGLRAHLRNKYGDA